MSIEVGDTVAWIEGVGKTRKFYRGRVLEVSTARVATCDRVCWARQAAAKQWTSVPGIRRLPTFGFDVCASPRVAT